MTTVGRVYSPAHVTETIRYKGSLISCSESVTAMCADAVSLGAVKVTQEYVRAKSSEPVPNPASPGLNLPQCLAVLRGLKITGMVDGTGQSWAQMLARLKEHRRVMLQVEMSELGSCADGRVGHMIFLQFERSDSGIYVNDPMCRAARWLPFAKVKKAAETFADATGVPGAGIRFAYSKRVPLVAVTKP